MSYIVRSDHIAITSGDKSTTRSKVSDVIHPVAPQHCVTVRDSSDTERRNGRIRKSHPRLPSATWLGCLLAASARVRVSNWVLA